MNLLPILLSLTFLSSLGNAQERPPARAIIVEEQVHLPEKDKPLPATLDRPKEKKGSSWRDRYELGPGDVLSFSMFGRDGLDRSGLRIAPDGTISYLNAQSVSLSGLTIDEARTKIEKELSAHFKNPRVIIIPTGVASKRYTILGKVVDKGVFTLDRPLTLVEAVANSRGMETGLFERATVELADLDRSFLSRRGKRLAIDFRRLFLESDLTQNVDIEPGDFIYIASNIANDYYVFGAVKNPGTQGLTPGASITAAFARRGGFTNKAWLDRILVVRGGLTKPKTYVVNLRKILAGKEPDFPLKPKDIIYICDRPWAKAEELTESAILAFVGAASSSLMSTHIPPLIKPASDSE